MPRDYQFNHELRHLVYFQAVARRLHFRQAAEALGVAQPSLSRQITQLERAVGAPLLHRTKRRVELSPAGIALLERVEPMLRALQRWPAELRAAEQGESGRIRIAFTGLAMATVLPGLLRECHRRLPALRIELNESPTSAQIAALKAGEIACGFLHPDSATPGLDTVSLLHEKNGVLLPGDHALARRRSLGLRDLANTPFVLFPRSHNPGFYDRMLAAFADAGVAPRIVEEVWPRANAVGLVRAGLGATFMCPSESRSLPADVVFRTLRGPAPESRLMLGWLKTPQPAPVLKSFLSVVTQHK
jgi:DNA-binding transcriptional LysR family regulator